MCPERMWASGNVIITGSIVPNSQLLTSLAKFQEPTVGSNVQKTEKLKSEKEVQVVKVAIVEGTKQIEIEYGEFDLKF